MTLRIDLTSSGPTTAERPRFVQGTRRPAAPDVWAVLARLTGRDRSLLHLLAEHHVLTTEQITALLFPNRDRAQRRLVNLYRWHVLDRFRRPGLDDRMTSWRYTLGTHGASLIAAERGSTTPRPHVLRERMLRLAAHPHLDHLLGVHDFFAALTAHHRSHPEQHLSLSLWLSERSATDACGGLARPDGLGVWTHPHGQTLFCLEYDTGRESLTTLLGKTDGYAALAHAAGPRLPAHDTGKPLSPSGFWLLIHVHSTRREANLRQHLHTLSLPGSSTAVGQRWGIATTTAEHTYRHNPADAIWLPTAGQQRVALAELRLA